MPGLVKSVNVVKGEFVNEGQEVLVIGKSCNAKVDAVLQNHHTNLFWFCRGYENAK